jgi:hypothetical protein
MDKDIEEKSGPGFVGPEVYTILRAFFKKKNKNHEYGISKLLLLCK